MQTSIHLPSFLIACLITSTLSACTLLAPQTKRVSSNQAVGKELLRLHNSTRKQGLRCSTKNIQLAPALKWNQQLASAAYQHSVYMHKRNELSHGNRLGSSTKQRLKRVNYQWSAFAENVGAGTSQAKTIYRLWKKSPSHCQNLMNPVYTELGAAQFEGFWTVIYASPK